MKSNIPRLVALVQRESDRDNNSTSHFSHDLELSQAIEQKVAEGLKRIPVGVGVRLCHRVPSLPHHHLATFFGELDGVHQLVDQEHASPASLKQVVAFERVGHGRHIEPRSRVPDYNHEFSCRVEGDTTLHLLVRIVAAPVADGVNQRFLQGEFDFQNLLLGPLFACKNFGSCQRSPSASHAVSAGITMFSSQVEQ